MNGKVLLDSNIIVYLSKNELDIDKVFDDKKRYFISIITYMETLGFNFQASDEKDFVRKILSLFELVNGSDSFLNRIFFFFIQVVNIISLQTTYKFRRFGILVKYGFFFFYGLSFGAELEKIRPLSAMSLKKRIHND